ncbi:Dipeptidyl aminopeptidase/acylaminoacyl peptidase [Pseudomonas flavescens]|uniref:Dipeptidyl aminopeptidase/acylaminoacyl peptidase n=1 Tax=Phytopseudomonas flavescens TaxID=29435 RepID=A0A1G8GN50_9GAMM|nr:S9 family peptidase [Pseudomonas flavescens]SDH95783.1 Dipeptidyl aminopeptidase/acylaminoacyl peptidase [Pseudomonas flavescens]
MSDSITPAMGTIRTPLIPRHQLFANPARAGMAISPDGQWLAWLENITGVMNIHAAPLEAPERSRQLTYDRQRGIQSFSWSHMPGVLLFSQDHQGDENWRLLAVDAASGACRDLTPPLKGARATLQSISRERPGEMVITWNARDPRFPDLYLVSLAHGNMTLLEENPGFFGFLLDDHYQVQLAARSREDGGMDYLRRDARQQWQAWRQLSPDDARNSGPSHFSADGRTLYWRDSQGRDTAALFAIDWHSGHETLLASDPRADIGNTLNDPGDYRPLAYGVTYERYRLKVLDERIRPDLDYLDSRIDGQWFLGSRSLDDRLWLIQASSDTTPGSAWLYRRDERSLTVLLELRPQLAKVQLARLQPTVLHARDGLQMVSYLTLPGEADSGELSSRWPLPFVLLVHGGPWARDGFGFNALHQWLANRGYGVLSVNFRGSTGFGKAFINAADGEWGGKMDEDLEDAVQWAIDRGIADPKRLAIFGGSYGGYAVLSALSRFPGRYACGIDLFGPSNLETLLAAIPAYWEAARAMQYRAIGDPRTEAGRRHLHDRSPLHRATAIRSPLLIAQGANDPRVRQSESEQMVQALRDNGTAVTYVLYPDEGHGFVREINRLDFFQRCESFLALYLGGRQEAEDAPAPGPR